MSASCVEKERIAPIAVQHYNFLKWIVLGLLAALLLGVLGKSCAAAAMLAAPTISVPNGTLDEPQAVTLTGNGAPNSRVVVDVAGQEFIVDVDGNGDWSLTTDTLPSGDYTAQVAAISPEGGDLNFVDSGEWSIGSVVVDGDDDDGDGAAPIAALAALGGLTLADFAADGDLTAGNFSWRGTGEPGATVELLANGEVLDRTTVDAEGNWSFDSDYNFAAGDVDFSARMIGADGADLGSIDGVTVSVPDLSMAMVSPTLTLDSDGELTEGDNVSFSGTAAPNAEIEILIDGEVFDTISADSDGNFTYTTSELSAGDYTLSARTADGELEADGVAFSVAVAAVAASTPVLSQIVAANSADGEIMFSGSADAGREVELLVDGVSVGTTTVDDDGNFLLSAPIDAGDRVVIIRDTDDDTVVSDEITVTVTDDGGVGVAIDSATTNADGTVTVNGTAPAGATVEIMSDGEVVGVVTVDDDGNFSIDVTPADGGDGTIGVQATADDGLVFGVNDVSIESGDLADAGSDDSAGGDSADVDSDDDTAADGSGSGDTASDNADAAGSGDDSDDDASANGSGSDDDDDSDTSTSGTGSSDRVVVTDVLPINDENGETPTIGTVDFGMSGTGRPGQLVIVLENGEQVGGAKVQADGTWSCTCILPPGEHTLVIQEADNPENVSEPVTFVVENLTEAPTPPTAPPSSGSSGSSAPPVVCKGDPPNGTIQGHIYIVAQCEFMSLIAQRLGTTLAKMMEYNPQVSAPNQIYPGQALNIPSDAGCFDNAEG